MIEPDRETVLEEAIAAALSVIDTKKRVRVLVLLVNNLPKNGKIKYFLK